MSCCPEAGSPLTPTRALLVKQGSAAPIGSATASLRQHTLWLLLFASSGRRLHASRGSLALRASDAEHTNAAR
jgi:hypothetical protein